MIYRTATDRIGPDVQLYQADDIHEAVELLRADIRSLAADEPEFTGVADEVDETWLEPVE